MSIEPALEPPETQGELISLSFPLNVVQRKLYGLFVIAMPTIAFGATELFGPEWQDGNLNSYVALLLTPEASWIFFPLLAFSIVCYIVLLINPTRYASYFLVRFGVYTGALLAMQFSILSALIFFHNGNLFFSIILTILWISPIFISKVYPLVQLGEMLKKTIIILLSILAVVGLIASIWTSFAVLPFVFILMVVTTAAPFWILLIYLQAATWLFNNYELKISIQKGFGIFAWIAVYAIAWRYDILKMYELYAALPPQPPPDCYIATAAAQGHPRFVGSHTVQRAGGLSMQVNGQLQRLKCAELALLAISPRVHGVLRRIYDVAGKALARWMTNPFVADVAYLLLKPAEWFAIFILKNIVPEIEAVSRRIYVESNVS
jgi:hypothetical protein